MSTIAAVAALILLVALAGTDLVVSGLSSDDLTQMGLQH